MANLASRSPFTSSVLGVHTSLADFVVHTSTFPLMLRCRSLWSGYSGAKTLVHLNIGSELLLNYVVLGWDVRRDYKRSAFVCL